VPQNATTARVNSNSRNAKMAVKKYTHIYTWI